MYILKKGGQLFRSEIIDDQYILANMMLFQLLQLSLDEWLVVAGHATGCHHLKAGKPGICFEQNEGIHEYFKTIFFSCYNVIISF